MNGHILLPPARVVPAGLFLGMASALAGCGCGVLAALPRSAVERGEIRVDAREDGAVALVEHRLRGDQSARVVELVGAPER